MWGGQIITLDPALYRGSAAGAPGAIFSGLVKLDRDLKVVPDLAESWSVSGRGRVYTFRLRPGLVFHDGRPLTAHDVKYSWERAADPNTESPTARTYLGDIRGVTRKLDGLTDRLWGVQVIDDLTLQVTIDDPKPYFLQKLAYPTSYIVDKANVESGPDWADRPNGAGPFRLGTWEKDDLLVLERNERYHGGVPWLSQVVYKLFAGNRTALYETRQIDITGLSIADVERALDPMNALNAEVVEGEAFCTSFLAFNVTMPPFDEREIREAFALALDVDKYLAVTLKGTAERAKGIVPPGIVELTVPVRPTEPEFPLGPRPPDFSPQKTTRFDPQRALSLIADSSYGAVDKLPPNASFVRNRAFHWMWRENIGVAVEAVSLPEAEDFHEREDARELPIWSKEWCADYPDPQNFLELLFHSESELNHFGYSDRTVDTLLESAAVERDPLVRAGMYAEAERLILADRVVVPLWHDRNYRLVQPFVKGYRPSPIGIQYLQDVYFER